MESYLGLKHVPFEHFACSNTCARKLNATFQKIQSRLKLQHDQEYQAMLEKYAAQEPLHRHQWRGRRGRRRELEVMELWNADFGHSVDHMRRRRVWTVDGGSRPGQPTSCQDRSKCIVM